MSSAFFADSFPLLFCLLLGLLTCSAQCRAVGFGDLVLGKRAVWAEPGAGVRHPLGDSSVLWAARRWGHPGQLAACCVTLGKSLSISGLCPGALEAQRPGFEQSDFLHHIQRPPCFGHNTSRGP